MTKTKLSIPSAEENVRVISESGGNEGTMSVSEALSMAISRGLDLIPVSKNGKQTVCRLGDLGKWEYEKNKKSKKNKKQSVKEFRFTARIEKHDIQTKAKKIEKNIAKMHPIKIVVSLQGRERAKPEIAIEKLNEILDSIKLNVREDDRRVSDQNVSVILYPVES